MLGSFRVVLKLLLDNLNSKDAQLQIVVLQVFTEMFKNTSTQVLWIGFMELIMLKILEAHSSEKREVSIASKRPAECHNFFVCH